MGYRKVVLQTLASWKAVVCFHVGPHGNPVGIASDAEARWFVVSWALDGAIVWSAGPFEAALANGAMNSSGEVMTTVQPLGASSPRPVLIRGGKVVRDFGDLFPNVAVVLAFNAAGLAVGAETIGATTDLRPFALDVRGSLLRYLDGPTGAGNAIATGLNEAGDIVVAGYKTFGDFHSLLYAGGSVRQELGPYFITDINAHRLCSGFRRAPTERAGLLDASTGAARWTELPLPPDAVSTRGRALNDKGQSIVLAEYAASSPSHYRPFLWSDGALRGLEELVPGDYLVPQFLSESGEISTTELGKPVLLTTSRPVRVSVDVGRPLWEIILAGTSPGGQPVFGVTGLTVPLPNGQAVELPMIPIPNEPLPGPDWANLNEAQRVALLASAVAALASRVHDQHARHTLTHAAQELLKRAPHG